MFDFLNINEGVIAMAELIVSIIIAIIGFSINRNIKISQSQSGGDNSANNQAGGNIKIS